MSGNRSHHMSGNRSHHMSGIEAIIWVE
jgi:hypothetical protein